MRKKSDSGLYPVGFITKAHGTSGGFLVEVSDSVTPPDQLNVIYISYPEKQWAPYRIEEIRPHADRNRNLFFVILEGIQSRNEAESLKGHHVMADRNLGPLEQEASPIGYQVIREDESVLGTVLDVIETPAYPVLVIQADDKQVLIPQVDEFVNNIGDETHQIFVRNTSELESLE